MCEQCLWTKADHSVQLFKIQSFALFFSLVWVQVILGDNLLVQGFHELIWAVSWSLLVLVHWSWSLCRGLAVGGAAVTPGRTSIPAFLLLAQWNHWAVSPRQAAGSTLLLAENQPHFKIRTEMRRQLWQTLTVRSSSLKLNNANTRV